MLQRDARCRGRADSGPGVPAPGRADSLHARDKGTQPVSEIDDLRPCDARKEILSATGETGYLVGKYRSADQQLIVLSDQPVEPNRNLVDQQASSQLFCLLA